MARLGVMVVAMVLACALPVFVAAAKTTSKSTFPVPSYYVFGDSTLDAGTNNYLPNNAPKANFPPYGITFFKGVPTGRFCDGRIFPDFLAAAVNLPLAAPYLSNQTLDQQAVAVNFASGGAGILAASSTGTFQAAVTLDTQLTQYENVSEDIIYNFGFDAASLILNDAIYQISIGSIDLISYFTNPVYQNAAGPIPTFLSSLLTGYKSAITRLYNQGARKVVVFAIGPLQETPLFESIIANLPPAEAKQFMATVDEAVQALNAQLEAAVHAFTADVTHFPMLTMVFADAHAAVTEFLQEPRQYGFTDVDEACCGAGKFGIEKACGLPGSTVCKRVSRALFWDSLHPTEATNKALFKLFFGGSKYIRPMSVKALAKLLIPGVPY